MRIFVSAIVLLALFTISCQQKKEKPKADAKGQPTVVDVIIAQGQNVNDTVEVNGTVVSGEYVEIRPEISGRIVYLNIPEGRRVGRGTVLARINDADLRAQLQKLQVQLELATKTRERNKKLLDIQGINEADYDLAVSQVNNILADISILKAQLDKTIIRAPFTGEIGLRQVSIGAIVSPTTIIATMQQASQMKIDFTVPESYTHLVHNGDKIVVELSGTALPRRRATVTAVEPQVSTATRNILVRAQLNETGPGVNPGGFAKVYLNARSSNSIMIPSNAIIPEARAKQVIVVKNGKANFVQVVTGNRKEALIEIESGLNNGDSVVVTGVLFARPNAPVKVRSVKKLEELVEQ
jgi:membrane fusion protein, multidrug efflux system